MRKTNVFGKKIMPSRPLYLLILVFFVTLISYLALVYISNVKIAELKQEQSEIQQAINSLLIEEQNIDYLAVEQLLPYLPNEFNQAIVYNELILVRDLAELSEVSNYDIDFSDNANSPFENNISSNLNFVKITISMTIDDYQKIIDYMDYLIELDRVYYIADVSLNIMYDNSAIVNLEIYTFYMN